MTEDALGPELLGSNPSPATFLAPQAVFLSWSRANQMHYCAGRDRDSARTAHERGEDAGFYLERAAMYEGV